VSLRIQGANPQKQKKFNWQRLHHDRELKQEFQLECRNQFETLTEFSPDSNVNKAYDIFQDCIEAAAEKVVGIRRTTRAPSWVSDATNKLRDERDQAKKAYNSSRTPENKQSYRDINMKLNKSYEADEIKHLEDKLQELNQAAAQGQHSRTWKIVNELSGKKISNAAAKVKRADGSTINSTRELLSEWKTYFSNLLNNVTDSEDIDPPTPTEDLPISTETFTREEVCHAVRQLKTGKAPGSDQAITQMH